MEKLVFLDETGATTNMTRSYGRAPKGQRCLASAPLGHWETTTFVAALRHRRLTAPMLTDGPMDGEVFLAYVQHFLCPTLLPGDIVVLDNLSSHKVDGVQEAIQAAGAILRYLPPVPPTRSGQKSESYSITSHPANAPSTSPRQDMYLLKLKML